MRIIQLSLFSLLLSVFAACEIHADEWQEVSRNSELAIYTRHRSGTQLEELRAVGELDAPAAKVHSTLADVASYPEFMPYMKESRLLSTDNQLCYMLLSPPIVGARDYTIRVHRGTQKDNSGSTTYYSHWELANSEGPPATPRRCPCEYQ